MTKKVWSTLRMLVDRQMVPEQKRLAMLMRRRAEAHALLEKLLSYQEQSSETFAQNLTNRPIFASVASGALGMFAKVDKAKLKQEQEIAALEILIEDSKNRLVAMMGEIKKYEKLIEIDLSKEAQIEIRKELKRADEFVNSIMARKMLDKS